jgi:two-component system, chemotaxis family, chemotaxis protein CheY
MRVLVVDDYAVLRRFVREQLKRLGVTETDEAASGGEALAKLAQKTFDLVMVDWNMEPMSGPQLITEIRCRSNVPDMPVLLMTGDVTSIDRKQAERMGLNDVVIKSQKLDGLRDALQRIGFTVQ